LTAVYKYQPESGSGGVSALTVAAVEQGDRVASAVGSEVILRVVSPEGRLLAQQILSPMDDETGEVTALRYSEDGKLLAVGFASGGLQFWQTDGETLHPLELSLAAESFRHESSIRSIRFGSSLLEKAEQFGGEGLESDTVLFATGGDDRVAAVWIARREGMSLAFEPKSLIRGHAAAVNSVAFVERYDRLVTASDDGSVRLWDWDGSGATDWSIGDADPSSAFEVLSLERHTEPVTSVDSAARATVLLSAGWDGRTILWPGVKPPVLPSASNR